MRNGFTPEFQSDPPRYKEKNNRSAINNESVVQDKIQEWVTQGYVTVLDEQPHCCNPLSVAEKRDGDTGLVKKRVVLDMSRHVNNYVVKQNVQLDDLAATEAMRHRGEYQCVFDLENQYFHVQLHPDVRKYFGFAWTGADGVERYYCFTVMVYGFAPAAAVVTRLIKPIMGFLHEEGVRISIYMDDGNVVGATQEEATEAMDLAVTAFQLGGWNIQWKKSDLQAKSQVKYLGFMVDLADFTYSAASSKVQDVEADIQAFMNPEQIYKVKFSNNLFKLQ
jgi:hypothetical protein